MTPRPVTWPLLYPAGGIAAFVVVLATLSVLHRCSPLPPPHPQQPAAVLEFCAAQCDELHGFLIEVEIHVGPPTTYTCACALATDAE